MGLSATEMEPNKTHTRRLSQFSLSSRFHRPPSVLPPAVNLPTCEERVHYPIYNALDPCHSTGPPKLENIRSSYSSDSECPKQLSWVQQLPRRSIHKARSGFLAITGWRRGRSSATRSSVIRSSATRSSSAFEDTPWPSVRKIKLGKRLHGIPFPTSSTQEEITMGNLHRTKSSLTWGSTNEPGIDTLIGVSSARPLTVVSSAPQVLQSNRELGSEGSPGETLPVSRRPSYTTDEHTRLIPESQSMPIKVQNQSFRKRARKYCWGTDGTSDSDPAYLMEDDPHSLDWYKHEKYQVPVHFKQAAVQSPVINHSVSGSTGDWDQVIESEDMASSVAPTRALPTCLMAGVASDGNDSHLSDVQLTQDEPQKIDRLPESLTPGHNVQSSIKDAPRCRLITMDHDTTKKEGLQLHSRPLSCGPAISYVTKPREISKSSIEATIAFPGIHRALMEQEKEDQQKTNDHLLYKQDKPAGIDDEPHSTTQDLISEFEAFQDTMTPDEVKTAFDTVEVDCVIPMSIQLSAGGQISVVHMVVEKDHETLKQFTARQMTESRIQDFKIHYPQYDGSTDTRLSDIENNSAKLYSLPTNGSHVQSQKSPQPPVVKQDPVHHNKCAEDHLSKHGDRYGLHVSRDKDHETLDEFVSQRKDSPKENHYPPQYDGCMDDHPSRHESSKDDSEGLKQKSQPILHLNTMAECTERCDLLYPISAANSLWSPIDSSSDEEVQFSNFKADEYAIIGEKFDVSSEEGHLPIQRIKLDDFPDVLLVRSVRTHRRRRHPTEVEESESKEDFFSCQWE